MSARVRRSARAKYLRLNLSQRFELVFTAPEELSFETIQEMAPRFQPWLEKKCRDMPLLEQEPLIPASISVPLLGKEFFMEIIPFQEINPREISNYPVAIMGKKGAKKIAIAMRESRISIWDSGKDEEFRALALRALFRKMAELYLVPYLRSLVDEGGYKPVDIVIRSQKTRWATCTINSRRPRPYIHLNWRALLLPLPLLRHLCWHELTHLRQMNHSPAFYAELAIHSPDWPIYEKALNTAWQSLGQWTFPSAGRTGD